MKRVWLSIVGLGFAVACGSSSNGDLFGKGSGGSGNKGGTSGSGGGNVGGKPSGGASGNGGTGAKPSGGAPGGGGAPTGGAPGGGGVPTGGAPGGGGVPTGGAPGGGTGGAGGGTPGACEGHCGDANPVDPTGCYCDALCLSQGDCCDGFVASCGTGTVLCDQQICTLGKGDICCQNWNGSGYDAQCANAGTSCTSVFHCDGPEDCAGGQVCCGTIDSFGEFDKFECRPPSQCDYNTGVRVICTTDPNACPAGYVCKPSSYPSGYDYCGKP